MGCGEFIVKYILFFANLFFALAGLALLGLGIAVQLRVSQVTEILDTQNIAVAPVLTIIVGSIVFCIAFFGCCGSIRESNCMLVTYAIFMIILMVSKIVLASFIFVNLNGFLDEIPQVLNRAFNNSPQAFQAVETTFSCCGPNGAIAYLSPTLPNSCCNTPPCTLLNANGACNDAVHDFVSTFGLTIGIGVICVGAIELVAVIFSLCLANHVRNKDRRVRY